jgi:hypothetical protein
MRHTDIRTTMNIYGDVVTDEMEEANSKVVGLALSGPTDCGCDRLVLVNRLEAGGEGGI